LQRPSEYFDPPPFFMAEPPSPLPATIHDLPRGDILFHRSRKPSAHSDGSLAAIGDAGRSPSRAHAACCRNRRRGYAGWLGQGLGMVLARAGQCGRPWHHRPSRRRHGTRRSGIHHVRRCACEPCAIWPCRRTWTQGMVLVTHSSRMSRRIVIRLGHLSSAPSQPRLLVHPFAIFTIL
jgi:hypothetical protein